jgi:hypothetical protein
MRAIPRADVRGFRVRAQQLDRDRGTLASTSVLDIGVQDTGPDGATWALAVRGLSEVDEADIVLLWTIRAAPHAYRRGDVNAIATAVGPYSDADAGKRIFDAARPLKAAGIANLDALDAVGAAMRAIVTRPTAKGEVSTRLTAVMDEPYLRYCRPCQATHLYETRSAWAPCAAAWSWSPAHRRRCCGASPASPRPHAPTPASTWSARTCGCSARPPRSTSPSRRTRRSRTSPPTGPRTSPRSRSARRSARSSPATWTPWPPGRPG